MPGTNRLPARKALSIGIRYKHLKEYGYELTSPHKDTETIESLLLDDYKYRPEDITVLRDDDEGKYVQPTRENILAAMHTLVAGCSPGDHFVFHYSGHGGQTRDNNGADNDGMEDVIWPLDIDVSTGFDDPRNFIEDDDIHDILVEHLCPGAHFVMIFDCCHSGTAAELPYYNGDYCPAEITTKVKSVRIRGGGEQYLLEHVPATKHVHTVTHDTGLPHATETPHAVPTDKLTRTKKISALAVVPDVTSWSACKDDQVTFEISGQGLFIYAFATALRENPTQSHGELLSRVTRVLANLIAEVQKCPRPEFCEPIETPVPQLGSLEALDQIMPTPMDM